MTTTVQVSRDPHSLHALRTEWMDLERRSTAAPGLFSGHAWCASWWEQFGGGRRLHLLTVHVDGRLVLLAPMMVERKAGVRCLCPIGGELGQYADVLVDAREANAETLVSAAFEALIHAAEVDVVELPRMRADAQLSGVVSRARAVEVATTCAVHVDCTDENSFDEWLAARSKKMRQNQRRSARAMAEMGELTAQADDRALSIEQFIDAAMAFKRAWLAERALSGKALEHDRARDFLVTLCKRLREQDSVRTASLRLDGELVATGLGFEQHGRFYYYLGAYEPSIERAGPGRLQMENTLRWCFQCGLTHYDMLPPDTPFKHLWSTRTTPISTWLVPVTLRGRVYAEGWHQRLRPLTKRAYARVPGAAKRALGRLLLRRA